VDELQTIRGFRSDGVGAGADDPVRERTIARVRTLIEQEAHSARSARRRLPLLRRRRFFVIALVAAVLVAAVALVPNWQSSPSLVGRALAAIGSGSVLHVVGELPTGAELVDLNSGSTTPVMQQEEIWFDESRGMRRDVVRVGGAILDDTLQTKEGGWTPHGIVYDCAWIAAHPQQATKAGVSCSPSGDNGTTPRTIERPKPVLDPGLAGFADGYRRALTAGAAREAGSGVLDGQPVDWLVFQTTNGNERVALARATHKPVLIEGAHGYRLRISSIESRAPRAGDFRKPTSDEAPLEPSRGDAADEQALALDPTAIAASYAGALWPGADVEGLRLVSATRQTLVTAYPDGHRPTETGVGLELVYGSLTANGHVNRAKPYVIVSEAPTPSLAFAYKWGFLRGATPPTGQLYLEPARGSDGLAIGFMNVGGMAVVIEAPSNDLVLAAARALHRTGG
jgi:hypothetical protein